MLSFFPRGVLDEILNLIKSVSEGFPSYSYTVCSFRIHKCRGKRGYMFPYSNEPELQIRKLKKVVKLIYPNAEFKIKWIF